MSLSATKCSRLVVIFCNVLFSWISGSLLVLFGVIYLYDPSYLHYYTLITTHAFPQYVFILFSLSIVALGGFIITLGLFGCFGTICENQCIVKTYVYLLVVVFLIECGLAGGSLFLYFFFSSVESEFKTNLYVEMKQGFNSSQLQNFDSALDYAQSNLHCCGVYNYTDYEESRWKDANLDLKVPDSCCSQIPITATTTMSGINDFEENAEGTESSAEISGLIGRLSRCQSQNPMESDEFLYVQGCWSHLRQIYNLNILFAAILFASLALLQLLGVIFPVCWVKRVDKRSRRNRINYTRQSLPLL